MICTQCQTDNKAGRKFCSVCGQPLSVACERCGFVNDPGDRFCGGCGSPLAAQAQPVTSAQLSVASSQSPAPSTQAEAEAEACFLKAIEIARHQQAKSFELRASVSLARLWQQQGKQHEARNTLSAIYNWFTEGFDTAELKEAQALLEKLS